MGNWVDIGIKAIPLINIAVNVAERFFTKDKEEEACRMFAELLNEHEGGPDVSAHPKVQKASRNVMRAIVAFQNAVRETQAASGEQASAE